MVSVSKCLAVIGLGLAAAYGAQADIYKWVDADGRTYFSERKPMIEAPVETILEDADDEPAAVDTSKVTTETEGVSVPAERNDPSAEPALCEGDAGATAIGALAMVLNRSYIASMPDFVADNGSAFAADEVYACMDAIFEHAPSHEQIAGCEGCTVSPDAPLAVLLESSGSLVTALRGLNEGVAGEWQKIRTRMELRRPRLEVDMGDLTKLIRGVADDARATARRSRVRPGTK